MTTVHNCYLYNFLCFTKINGQLGSRYPLSLVVRREESVGEVIILSPTPIVTCQ